jgi:predicted ArsR family transcriptional regulator
MGARPRNEGLIRVLQMAERLRSGRWSLDALARDFGVSTRTVRRDLAALQLAGLPLRYNNAENQGPGGLWWIARTDVRATAQPTHPVDAGSDATPGVRDGHAR